MAIEGKLVPQDLKDEPATDLLAKITNNLPQKAEARTQKSTKADWATLRDSTQLGLVKVS